MMLDFEVLGRGQLCAVYVGEDRVSPLRGNRNSACSYIPGLERRRRATKERPCIS